MPALLCVVLLSAGVFAPAAEAQTAVAAQGRTPPGDTREPVAADEDPTRPVFISVRPEVHHIAHGVERRLFIGRYDARLWPTRRPFSRGAPGVVVRLEAPLVHVDAGPAHEHGLGDVYAQFIVIPYVRRRFAVAAGSGMSVPTATDALTGTGKWIVAPLAAPLWRLPRGLVLIKLQHVTSVAGDATRPDVHHLLATPVFIHTLGQRWWIMLDSESKTSWIANGRTGIKSGLQFGRRLRTSVGVWLKPEVWWGPHRDGEWNMKFGVVWYERRR